MSRDTDFTRLDSRLPSKLVIVLIRDCTPTLILSVLIGTLGHMLDKAYTTYAEFTACWIEWSS